MARLGRAARTAAAGTVAGALGVLVSVATSWLLLLALNRSDTADGLIAGLLRGEPTSLVATSATTTGAPVAWRVPGLGIEGHLWPIELLGRGSPLAALVLAPVAGGLVLGATVAMMAARQRPRHRYGPLLAVAVVAYAGATAIAGAVASALSSGAFVEVRVSAPLVFGLTLVWATATGSAGRAMAARAIDAVGRPAQQQGSPPGRRAAPVLAAAATLLLTLTVAGSQRFQDRPSTAPTAPGTTKIEPVPVGAPRGGVPEALAIVRATSGDAFQVAMDPWRGVPSFLSMRSPFGGDAGAWIQANAGLFGIADPTSQLSPLASRDDDLGQRHQWYEQTVRGVPVFGARLGLHLDKSGTTVDAISNGLQPALAVAETRPQLPPEQASAIAAGAVPGARVLDRPRLMVLPDKPHPDRPTPAALVWKVVVEDRSAGDEGTWAYFVDAGAGQRVLRAVRVSEPFLSRRVWDYHNLPTDPTGPADRSEGDAATGVAEVDQAYEYTGDFYRYFSQVFGRDSYNGHGAQLLTMVRYREVASQPYLNAFWNGASRTFFGEGMATREIVGHEWTHAVIQSTADLIYENQSGALNESFADVFGESIEHFATGDNDWLIGPGSALGTIRSFSNPPDYGQPDHLRNYEFNCLDSGGVHTDSGIANKAFYVLSQRIGIAKAAAISYRSLTQYLGPTSGFTDARNSAIQSAWDLYGKSSQEAVEVWRAWGSVGVDGKAELPRVDCACFAEASLHGDGLAGLDSLGPTVAEVAGGLLRAHGLLNSGTSPAWAHFGLLYRQANASAFRLLAADSDLQRRTAHAMQSLSPILSTVDTPNGGQVEVTRALVDELLALMDAYAAADRARGSGELASMLDAERARINFDRLVGMTANEAKAYLDQTSDGAGVPGVPPQPQRSAVVDADVQRSLASTGRADVIVLLRDHADLRAAPSPRSHASRAEYVYRELGLTASRSQRGLHSMLTAKGADFEQFWIVNAILVRHADVALVAALAAKGEVSRIRRSGAIALQTATVADERAVEPTTGVEWGVARVRAPDVWSTFGTRGEGIVVANIDTGVQYDHPALIAEYRGRDAQGHIDHNYNWYDPAGVCGDPRFGPCDNNGHGTHTMGTMVGLDGANQIGVAPGATWIAAKGCESSSCTDVSLLSAGQWVIAPTDLNGLNPRPDLAPNIVNNSWGGGQGDPFYDEIINAWVQAGIFPAFANGNAGPLCDTAISPGDSPAAFAVGAFDQSNAIASFSSRGPSAVAGEVKPDLAAPGVAVRSSVRGDGYSTLSGTSMATPHLAGAVALLWSAAPSLVGDIAATRQLLADTAVPMPADGCGGTDGDNNTWGAGRLDVYSAVAFSPHGPVGSILGTVTDSHGAPLRGVTVTATGPDDVSRTALTDASGAYSLSVPVGTYSLVTNAFAFRPVTASAQASESAGTRHDFVLLRVPAYPVRGQVLHDGVAVRSGTVTIEGAPLEASAIEADGAFGINKVPSGQWTLAYSGDGCAAPTTVPVDVTWDRTITINAPDRVDTSGYRCTEVSGEFPDAPDVLPLSGDDASVAVSLPFGFPYFGDFYSTAYVSTNGSLNFDRPNPIALNVGLPSIGGPNTAIYPFWDDLVVDATASVRTGVLGTAPSRRFVIEWDNVTFAEDPSQRVTFAVELSEGGRITMYYGSLEGGSLARGASATAGIEDGSGDVGIEYLRDTPLLTSGTTIQFHGVGMVVGTVRNANGDPLADVAVSSGDVDTITDYAGRYRLPLATGAHSLLFRHPSYRDGSVTVTVANDGDVATADVTLVALHNVVSGHVRDDRGDPVADVRLTLLSDFGYPYFATSDAAGAFRFVDVGPGSYNLQADGECLRFSYLAVIVDGDEVIDRVVERLKDAFGYRCYAATVDPAVADTPLALTGDDAIVQVSLPFAFSFYGVTYNSAYVSTNGMINFMAPIAPPDSDFNFPTGWAPNGSLYACWDDLEIDASASMATADVGAGAERRFVVEWRNALVADTGMRVTLQAEIFADGRIRYQYLDIDPPLRRFARVGIEKQDGGMGISPGGWYNEMGGVAYEFRKLS